MDLVTSMSYVVEYLPFLNSMFVQLYTLTNFFLANLANFASAYIAYKMSVYLYQLSVFLYKLTAFLVRLTIKISKVLYIRLLHIYTYVTIHIYIYKTIHF